MLQVPVMATWTIQNTPFPHLRVLATTQEGQSLRISAPGMMRTQPGWFMHVPVLVQETDKILRVPNLPPAVLKLLQQQQSALHTSGRVPGVVVALYFASDMEDHGWYRPNVEAHETQHGRFHTFAFDPRIPDRTPRFERHLRNLLPTLSPYIDPYLPTFSLGTALDEFLADLSGVEAGVLGGLSPRDAARTSGRNVQELTAAWTSGLRSSTLFSQLTRDVLNEEARGPGARSPA